MQIIRSEFWDIQKQVTCNYQKLEWSKQSSTL